MGGNEDPMVKSQFRASLLSGYGPRVQLLVFECEVRSQAELQALRADLRTLIDLLENQVRSYPTTSQNFSDREQTRGSRSSGAPSSRWAATSGRRGCSTVSPATERSL